MFHHYVVMLYSIMIIRCRNILITFLSLMVVMGVMVREIVSVWLSVPVAPDLLLSSLHMSRVGCPALCLSLSLTGRERERERERESATVRFVTREAETLECPSLSHLERYSLSSRLNMLDTCYMLSMLI